MSGSDSPAAQQLQFPLAAGEAQYSTVISVSPDSVWQLISDFDAISNWARPLVEVCLIENDVNPRTVGCRRRSVLRESGQVIREKLVAHHESQCKRFMSFVFNDSEIEITRRFEASKKEYAVHQAASFEISEVPNPFPCRLHELQTTISVLPLSTDPNKAFVELYSTFTIPTDALVPPAETLGGPPEAVAEVYRRLGVKEAEKLSSYLISTWLRPQLVALSDAALAISYPVATGFSVEYRKEYDAYDDFLVELSLKKGVEERTVNTVQQMLESWTLLTREVYALRGQVTTLTEELAASRHITNAANSLVVASSSVKAEYGATPARQSRQENSPPPSEIKQPNFSEGEGTTASGVQANAASDEAGTNTIVEDNGVVSAVKPFSATRDIKVDRATETDGPFRATERRFDPDVITRALHRTALADRNQEAVSALNHQNVTDPQYLQHLFELLDVEKRGYLNIEEFSQLWTRTTIGELELDDIGTPRKGGNSAARPMNARQQEVMVKWLKRYGKKSQNPLVTGGEFIVPVEVFSYFLLQAAKQ